MDFGTAAKRAERFLPVLNGMMRLRFAGFQQIKLKGVVGTADDGRSIPVAWTSFTVARRDSVAQAFRYLKEGGPTLGRHYRLAKDNGAVAEALLYFGRSGEPFFDLYKTYEVVKESMGGEDAVQEGGFAPRNQINGSPDQPMIQKSLGSSLGIQKDTTYRRQIR